MISSLLVAAGSPSKAACRSVCTTARTEGIARKNARQICLPCSSPQFVKDYYAYVGMSRPKTLLCVAIQSTTYEKSKGVFDNDWEIIDLRY